MTSRASRSTTVQPKAVIFLTDAKLLHAAIRELNRLAAGHGSRLRQSYCRIARTAAMIAERYADGILRNVDFDGAKVLLHVVHSRPAVVEINAFVVQQADRTMLVDTSAGGYMSRNAGCLASNLRAARIDTLAIDTVFPHPISIPIMPAGSLTKLRAGHVS